MLSSDNRKEIIRKQQSLKQRFALRKMTMGVTSVLIGLTFMGGYEATAHADTTLKYPSPAPIEPTKVTYTTTEANQEPDHSPEPLAPVPTVSPVTQEQPSKVIYSKTPDQEPESPTIVVPVNKAGVNYHIVDDDDHQKQLFGSMTPVDEVGKEVPTGLQNYHMPYGYEFASGEHYTEFPKTVTIPDGQPNNVQDIYIHLVHKKIPNQKGRKTVTREIWSFYVGDPNYNGPWDAQKQEVTFNWTGYYDQVTGRYVPVSWEPAEQTLPEFVVPQVKGYEPSNKIVPAVTVTPKDIGHDLGRGIGYRKVATAKITYIDDTDHKTLSDDQVTGDIDYKIQFPHDVASQVKSYEKAGYKRVSNNFDGNKFDSDNDKNVFEVHFVHATQEVTRDIKAGTLTVHYVEAKTGKTLHEDTKLTGQPVTQHGVKDLVTKVTSWKQVPTDVDMRTIEALPIKGYTPDVQKQVATITVNKDKEITIKYTKQEPARVTDSKTVKETIHYVYADGSKAINDRTQEVTLTRYGQKDPVTGKITWDNFNDDSFAAVLSPTLKGYTPDKAKIEKTAADGDKEFTVTYTKNADIPVIKNVQTGKVIVHFVDRQTGQPVHEDVTIDGPKVTQHGSKDPVTDEVKWDPIDESQIPSQDVDVPDVDGYTHQQTKQTVHFNLNKTNEYTVVYDKATTPTPDTPNPEEPQPEPKPQPTPETPEGSAKVTPTVAKTAPTAATQTQSATKQLPQTGNDTNTSVLALGVASLASLLGLSGYKKRHAD